MKVTSLFLVCSSLIIGADVDRGADGVVFSPHRSFRIPLNLSDAERQGIAAIRLYVSRDSGKTWTQHAEGTPEMNIMTFRADQDGPHWFSIALVDAKGTQTPAAVEKVEPGLKVVVDTKKPSLVLKPIHNRSGRLGIRWEAVDDNFDAASLRFAVWESEAEGWKSFTPETSEKKLAWFPEGKTCQKIQMLAKDRAGNAAVLEVDLEGNRFSKRTPATFALADSPETTPDADKSKSTVSSAGSDAASTPKPVEEMKLADASKANGGAKSSDAPKPSDASKIDDVKSTDRGADLASAAKPADPPKLANSEKAASEKASSEKASSDAPPLPPELPAASPKQDAAVPVASKDASPSVEPPLPPPALASARVRTDLANTSATMPEESKSAAREVKTPMEAPLLPATATDNLPTPNPAEPSKPAAVQHTVASPVEKNADPTAAAPGAPATPKKTILSRRSRMKLNYELSKTDEGAARVEAWGTRDEGQTWQRLAVDDDEKSPIVVDVPNNGVWGLMIVVSAANSNADTTPKAGTQPEVFVEIDTEPPHIELMTPRVSRGQLTLRWSALDTNLGKACTEILIAEQPSGPWKSIAADMDNTGEFLWNFVREGVQGPRYFRVSVKDKAGNVGSADTPEKVMLVTTPPRGRVVDVAPVEEDPAP